MRGIRIEHLNHYPDTKLSTSPVCPIFLLMRVLSY